MEIYVVKQGDTLRQIARRYGVAPGAIAEANQLSDPDVLSVGQALVIPLPERYHTVRRGDTLYSIARSHGVGLERLLAANPGISNPDRIYPGQRIMIPAPGEMLGRIVVNGYITNASDETLRATLPYLTFLSPFSYRTDARGELTPTFGVNLSLSAAERVANLLTVTNLREQGAFPATSPTPSSRMRRCRTGSWTTWRRSCAGAAGTG